MSRVHEVADGSTGLLLITRRFAHPDVPRSSAGGYSASLLILILPYLPPLLQVYCQSDTMVWLWARSSVG